MLNISFFGDSISVGQGVSIHDGWIVRISKELGKDFAGSVVVSRSAANGRTTRLALEAMPYEIQSKSPDILIIQFGMNDCNYWNTDNGLPRVSQDSFKANLKEIIDRAKFSGVRKIILNSNHPTGRVEDVLSGGITYEDSNIAYNKLIRDVAANNPNVIFADIEYFFKELGVNTAEYLIKKPDLLHLNSKGHSLYYKIMKPIILSSIKSLIDK